MFKIYDLLRVSTDSMNIDIDYFNDELDGLNSLTFRFSHNQLTIFAMDDSGNEYLVKTLEFNELLSMALNIVD